MSKKHTSSYSFDTNLGTKNFANSLYCASAMHWIELRRVSYIKDGRTEQLLGIVTTYSPLFLLEVERYSATKKKMCTAST